MDHYKDRVDCGGQTKRKMKSVHAYTRILKQDGHCSECHDFMCFD